MRIFMLLRVVGMLGAALAFGCMKPDSTGPEPAGNAVSVGDDDRVAGATSSTNWPAEDAGTQPIQIIGTADSVLSFSFMQAPEAGKNPVAARLAATFILYRSGYNPVFDSVPTLRIDFPVSDTCKIKSEDFNRLMPGDLDTLRFSVEVRTDTVRGFFVGFLYSKKQKKILRWPTPINESGSTSLATAHYKFAGIPDSAFQSFQSDNGGNAKFYYYIPGSPYFWTSSFGHDSLYIGPTFVGEFPLRCAKVVSDSDPKAGYTIEVYALSLVKELVYDSLHHAQPSTVFKLGEHLSHFQGNGELPIRPRP